MNTRTLLRILAVLALVPASGCAKYPPNQVAQSHRRLTVDVYLAEPVNPAYYYFVAIDTDGNPLTGPTPVLHRPWGGTGWAVGPLSYFVEYHLSIPNGYGCYSVDPNNILLQTYQGAPLLYDRDEANRLQFTIDLNTIDPLGTLQSINVNIITTDVLPIDPNQDVTRQTDGLGPTGNDYVTIPLTQTQTYTNAESSIPEQAGDVLDPQLDIVDWQIEVALD